MIQSVLLSALAFAQRGHAVFPVNWPLEHRGRMICSCGRDLRGLLCGNPAKHPYGKLAPHGLLSATTETDIIKDWFGSLAPQANLGVTTDRLVVIDVDPRHGGGESFSALEREHEIPLTWRVLTGGGGEHLLFACPDGVEIANVVAELIKPPLEPPLGRGIDIRARGGYIVAPPSRHISGRWYCWSVDHHPADVTLAPAPDWLVARLTARRSSHFRPTFGRSSRSNRSPNIATTPRPGLLATSSARRATTNLSWAYCAPGIRKRASRRSTTKNSTRSSNALPSAKPRASKLNSKGANNDICAATV